ncbi:MAG: deoxyribonuclease IV [Gemmatimonadetes bacterium]|nr:deoxyribonuclease IV [Gemmatimonadota bacterium]
MTAKKRMGAAKKSAKKKSANKKGAKQKNAKTQRAKKMANPPANAAARTPATSRLAKVRSASEERGQREGSKVQAPPPPPFPPPPPAPLGAHISTAGGTPEAPPRADLIGATAMQIFTKQGNRWAEREVGADEATAFRTALAASGVRFTNAHDSYLINLASPDAALRERSIASFAAELRRCHALGLDALVSHPGNFMDDRASGIARNADAIAQALEQELGPTRLLMELTAGQGTVIGSTFEEMAELLHLIPARMRARIGVCLDTAHVFAAGYDLRGDYDGVWARFADVLGYESLGLIHLNDSKAPLGSKKDRHEEIGAGALGDEPFRRLMTDARLAAVPKLLETPKGDDMVTNDRRALEKLRAFANG